ncbi:MAG: hypothetical protein H7301_12665 [Cryobacterium sp.]|nr:hypothetical protein [Oligoflexia bacterium]
MKKVQFRWKYAVSTFLVCGVLSLTLGKAKVKDPLVVEAITLAKDFDKVFKINKDPKTATQSELFGPDEKTFGPESEVYRSIHGSVFQFGRKVSRESFSRALDPTVKVASDQNRAVAEAAVIYANLQTRLYANYLRLAHDSAFKTITKTDSVDYLLENIGRYFSGSEASVQRDELQRWLSLNKAALATSGARSFSSNALDYLNIKLDPKTAAYIRTHKDFNKEFSLRHVKDSRGIYSRVELFLNSFDKQMVEFAALARPKDKPEYLKLLQFAAIREGLSNRWAIRRMMGHTYFAESPISSCGADLVSFRTSGKISLVSSLEAYDSLWQDDRFGDLLSVGREKAVAATLAHPLLSMDQSGEVVLQVLSQLPSFQTNMLPQYRDKPDALLGDLSQAYGEPARRVEEVSWSDLDTEGANAASVAFSGASFPADDMSISAVGSRYTDKAYALRRAFLINGIWKALSADHYTGGEKKGQALYPELKSHSSLVQFAVDQALAKSESQWKSAQRSDLEKALTAAMGGNVLGALKQPTAQGFMNDQNSLRFEKATDDYRTIAASGSLGFLLSAQAEKVTKAFGMLEGRSRPDSDCRPTSTGRGGITGRTDCLTEEAYRLGVMKKNSADPTLYLGNAPFRILAKNAGMKSIQLPKTAEHVSQFFYKKLNYLVRFGEGKSGYIEPSIAEEIASNRFASHGMEIFFSELAKEFQKKAPDAEHGKGVSGIVSVNSCSKALVPLLSGRVRAKNEPKEVVCPKPEPKVADEADHLSAAAILAAKTAYTQFVTELGEARAYKYPDLAAKKFSEQTDALRAKERESRSAVQDATSNQRVAPGVQKTKTRLARNQSELDREAARIRELHLRRIGYFRTGRDGSFTLDKGEYAAKDNAEKEKALALFRESLALLGLSMHVEKGGAWAFDRKKTYYPDQVRNLMTTERLIQMQMPNARVIDRMFATVTDQLVFGKVLEAEAIMKAPILGIQNTSERWNEEDDSFFSFGKKEAKDEPILLHRLARAWNAKSGWNEKFYRDTLRWSFDQASGNDLGKVETFCKAEIKNYQSDRNFRKMFESVSGIRDALSSNPDLAKYDRQIASDVRSTQEGALQALDPYMSAIGLAMLLLMFWQFAPVVFGLLGMTSVTAFFSSAGVAMTTFFGGFGTLTMWLLGTPTMVIFSMQTYLMVSTNHYRLPPQLFTYQVANSRVQNMETGPLAGRPMTNREKMTADNQELNKQLASADMAILMEPLNGLAVGTGLYHALGIAGASKFARLSIASSDELKAAVRAPSLPELIKEKGSVKAGLKEYFLRSVVPVVRGSRVSVVRGSERAHAGLQVMMADKLGAIFPERKVLLNFFSKLADEHEESTRNLMRTIQEVHPKQLADLQDLAEATQMRERLLQEMEQYKGQDLYVSVAYSEKFDEVLESEATLRDLLSPSKSEKKLRASMLALYAKASSAKRDEQLFRSFMDRLSPTSGEQKLIGSGEAETVSFFDHLDVSELSYLRNTFLNSKKLLGADTRKSIGLAYSDYEYLVSDWELASQRAKAERKAAKGRPDFFVNDDGSFGKADPTRMLANPSQYRVRTLRLDEFVPSSVTK